MAASKLSPMALDLLKRTVKYRHTCMDRIHMLYGDMLSQRINYYTKPGLQLLRKQNHILHITDRIDKTFKDQIESCVFKDGKGSYYLKDGVDRETFELNLYHLLTYLSNIILELNKRSKPSYLD